MTVALIQSPPDTDEPRNPLVPVSAKLDIIGAHETASTAAAVQAKTQVEARYMMAIRQPRSLMQFRAKLLDACKRPRFAETARYAKPVGGGRVEGWSIRFAEEVARSLTNVLCESAVIYDGEKIRIVRVMVTDLEANLTYPTDVTIEKTVERTNNSGRVTLSQRTNSSGRITYTVLATDDELLNKQNALVSKAMRTGLLRVAPADILEEAEETVRETLRTEDAQDPAAKAKKIADAFYALGVMPDRLEKVLGHPLSNCTPAEVTLMRTWVTALKEGETTWKEVEDTFGPDRPKADTTTATTPGNGSLKDRLTKKPATPDTDGAA